MKKSILVLFVLLSGCTTYSDSHDTVYAPTEIIGNGNIPQTLPTNTNWGWKKHSTPIPQNKDNCKDVPMYMQRRSMNYR